ncbi:peptidase M50 [Candidatus Woesearchaeota archaeon]|nr:peptidase M50 [Candidatus Woesearchaeota archaeon]
MRFSQIEIEHLVKAWLAISIAYTILIARTQGLSNIILVFFVSLFTIGAGFLLHELAHKFVAQHYRLWAEFRADMNMLLLAIVISFAGVLFAAPGAVMIGGGHVSRKQNGIISVAGALTNIGLALIFLLLALVATNDFILFFAKTGLFINALLAVFNMIPFGILDGKKVFNWNKTVWASVVITSVLLIGSNFLF